MATALGYPYRPMMKMEPPSAASPLPPHPGMSLSGLTGLHPGLSGLSSGFTTHPSGLPHPSAAFSAHQPLSHHSASLSHMTSLSYSSPLSYPGLTAASIPPSRLSPIGLPGHHGLSGGGHLSAPSTADARSTGAGGLSPSPSAPALTPPAAAAAAHAAFAAAGYHPAYAAAAAAAAFHQQSLASSGPQDPSRGPGTPGSLLMPQPRNSHSMPLR